MTLETANGNIGGRRRFALYARGAGAAAILIGGLVLLGWAFDIILLKSVLPGKVAMRPNTAICFLLIGAALLLLVLASGQRVVSATRRRMAVVFTTLASTIALAALSEYLFRHEWGVERLLVRNLVPVDDTGRMAAGTAVGFVLLGGALLLLDAKHKVGRLCSELLALATLLIGVLALLGYLYGIESLYGLFAYSGIAVHTAFLLVVLGLGVLFSRPESGLMRVITSDRGGGVMARRVLPVTVLLLVALAWLHLKGGLVLLVASGITILVVWVWLVAHSLNLSDANKEQALKALRESEERLDFALQKSHTGGWDLDLVNHTAHRTLEHDRIFGYSTLLPQWTYEMFLEHVLPEDRTEVDRRFREATATQAEWSFECRIRRPDGDVRWIWASGEHQGDGMGQPQRLAGIVQDITERKRAEEAVRSKNEELASMTQQLWQASKLATMGELAASIAHELNNPLATVGLRAEALLMEMPQDPDKRKPLEIIAQEVDRMANLVNNLLQFSRRSHRQVSTVDPGDEVATSVEFVNYHLRSRNIEVVQDFADGLPTIQADRQQLRQLFLNLLTNASDAMPQGGKLTLRAVASKLGEAKAVAIEVEDTGDGITAENLEKIWEPFFTTKPEGKGTGLGMGICRRIVEEHGGTIDVQSQAGHGTTIRIVFPATHEH